MAVGSFLEGLYCVCFEVVSSHFASLCIIANQDVMIVGEIGIHLAVLGVLATRKREDMSFTGFETTEAGAPFLSAFRRTEDGTGGGKFRQKDP